MNAENKLPAPAEFEVDCTDSPIVRLVFPPFGGNEPVDRVLVKMRAAADNERIAVCADARKMIVRSATPARRDHFYRRVDEFDISHGHQVVALAVVLSSWVEQHLFRAFIWMKKSKSYPVQAFRTRIDADDWLRTQLELVAESGAPMSTRNAEHRAAS